MHMTINVPGYGAYRIYYYLSTGQFEYEDRKREYVKMFKTMAEFVSYIKWDKSNG